MRIENRRAKRDYLTIEKHEAGIVLRGDEVKSIRKGAVSFQDSFCKIENGELFIYNMHISPYENSRLKLNPKRKRKLLLHKNEIKRLYIKQNERGFTIIPLTLYFSKNGIAKIEIAVAKGKRKYEKKEAIKQRDLERKLENESPWN